MNADSFVIVGNGSGGCAAAATIAQRGIPVQLYGRDAAKTERFRAAGGITLVEGAARTTTTNVEFVSELDGAAAPGARIVVMVPTSAIGQYARMLAPHLRPGSAVLLAPGHTGGALAFRTVVRSLRPDLTDVVIGETCTLPFVARLTGPTEVAVWRRLDNLLTGVLPATATAALVSTFAAAFDGLVPAGSVIESSLSNLNAVMHPAGMIGNVGWIEATSGGFRFYREGVTPGVARIMDGVDRERLAIGSAYGVELPGFRDMFHAAGLITQEVWARHDTYLAVHHSGPNSEIMAPGSLRDRYVEEDVGAGLVAMRALARCVEVPTPVIDALIALAGVVNDTDYLSAGMTAARLGIDGLDRDRLLASL
ncbi:NAD/NADP octopine/nopaline dehydrogenase family protein [Dactylosporangium sp. CA-233914]|uniref:NAD/NADP-dependent octopine/nopaline dehydrogenase family protein n=1 Tax=Dactylosporangium sp. CA-233914 TaxID=3239934 RepID=UPI003D8C382F